MGGVQNYEHEKLVDEILLAIGARPMIRVWKRFVGVGRPMNDPKGVIAFGIPGESDIQGILSPHGRMLCIEVKTGNADLSKKQQRWKTMVEKFGGVFIKARSVEQVLEELNQYL